MFLNFTQILILVPQFNPNPIFDTQLVPFKPLILKPINPPRCGRVAIAAEEGVVGIAVDGGCGVAQRDVVATGGVRR